MKKNEALLSSVWALLEALLVKNLPSVQETWVRSLGLEDLLEEKEMATYSNILAWEIPWTEEAGEFPAKASQESSTT